MARTFTRTLTLVDLNETIADWDASGSDVTTDNTQEHGYPSKDKCDKDGYTVIGSVKIPAYEDWCFGHTIRDGRGTVYVRLDSSAGQITGKIRIRMCNATYDRDIVIHEHTTQEQNNTLPTDPRTNPTHHIEEIVRGRKGLGIHETWFGGNGHLILLFKPDTNGDVIDVSDADNRAILPITIRLGAREE